MTGKEPTKQLFWVGSSRKDLKDAIYVLHVFQKKSKRGIKTPQKDLDLIKERLRRADQDHASWSKSGE